MSYLERLKTRIAEKPIYDELPKLSERGFGSFGSEPDRHILAKVASLPPDLEAGLGRLRTTRTPRITNPSVWPEIVADAVRIADEGWASQAFGLGWEPLHLFGWEPSADPDTWDYSLAVLLAGRPIRAVDERRFYMFDGNVRSFFERRERPGLTKFLWEQ